LEADLSVTAKTTPISDNRGRISQLSYLGDRPILRAFRGQLVHYFFVFIPHSSLFLVPRFRDLLPLKSFFGYLLLIANQRTELPKFLAFAPPCIYTGDAARFV
jgi:hypothetical protein